MKTLLLNGCSFTHRWNPSKLFVSEVGCEKVENISKVATSFQRTCRTTIEWIAVNGNPSFVMIPITFRHRWELAIAEKQEDYGPWFPMQNREHLFSTKQKLRDDVSKDKIAELVDLYYGCIPISVTYDSKIFTEIIMLSAFLESRNIKHLFFDMCNEFSREHIEKYDGFGKIKLIENNPSVIDLFSFCGNRYMHNTMPNKETFYFNSHHAPEQYLELEKYLLNYLDQR